ncbi:MAG: hypothetical protein C5B58_10000 [Acidobacteria bacterium]|nr:MAG: hypothetical protein C5B58_10000 [Acidobacteriota bacterium]
MHETEYRTQMIYACLSKAPVQRFASVLDLGCADGSILKAVARKVGAEKAEGLDLKAANSAGDSITIRRGDLLQFKPETTYELVVSNQVFEHIYEPWLPQYFHVLKQSCSANGIILISTPNRWRPKNIVRFLTLRRPYMMQPNPGIPPERHLGHHRECSFRDLRAILREYFCEPEWTTEILSLTPRMTDSRLRWIANLLVYFGGWFLWRPLFVSASQDHYAIIRHNGRHSYGTSR